MDQLPASPHEVSTGPHVTITADDVEAFTKAVLNQSDAYRTSNPQMEVPMDFGIKLGWKAIMKCLFPKSIPGDLLALVHLSNGFTIRDQAPKLKVLPFLSFFLCFFIVHPKIKQAIIPIQAGHILTNR